MEKPSFARFNILVVDDDCTSLSIVSAMLKHWDYDVVTVKRPVDALATIRIQHDIDLVVTDLHMPEMNGLELQKQISEEFINLPVIVMSSDDRESVIMKSLASGVVFYIVKPVSPDALKNVWQYAVTSKIGKSIFNIGEIGSIEGGSSSADKVSFDHHDIVSASPVIREQKKLKKNSKRKAASKGDNDEHQGEINNATAPKKAKVVWTNSLHNQFLQAIRHISLEKAVPKKILEFMNVPGLTRENVASHLQKYRIFLKRVAERGTSVASKKYSLRSSFVSTHSSSMMLQEAQEYAQIKENRQQLRASLFLPGYGGGFSALNGTKFGSIGFPSIRASRSNSLSQLGLLGHQDNFHQTFFGNTTNPIYQPNHGTTFGTGSNSLSCWNPTYTSVLKNMGTINKNPNSNDNGELVRAGQTRLNDYGLTKGTAAIEGVNAGVMGNATFHHLAPGDESSSSSSSSAFAGANEPENISMLPPLLSQQQHGLGTNDDLINLGLRNNDNNATVTGNTAQPEQFGEGIDFCSFLFDPSDYQFLSHQQQGEEGAVNPNFGSDPGTHQAELNLPINQSQNPDISVAFAVGDNAPGPWNEPTLDQLQEIEEVVNTEFVSSNAYHLNDYHSSFDQNPNQPGNQNNIINSEPNGPYPRENVPAENQGWDDFINSLFHDYPN